MFTPRSAMQPVLASVYTALNSTTLTGLAPLYGGDGVPEGIKPPYVVVRTPTETPWQTFGAPGSELVVPVESVSREATGLELIQLTNVVRRLLDRAALAGTSGYSIVACRWESNLPDDEIGTDGVRYRYMTSLFRVTVTQTS